MTHFPSVPHSSLGFIYLFLLLAPLSSQPQSSLACSPSFSIVCQVLWSSAPFSISCGLDPGRLVSKTTSHSPNPCHHPATHLHFCCQMHLCKHHVHHVTAPSRVYNCFLLLMHQNHLPRGLSRLQPMTNRLKNVFSETFQLSTEDFF